MRRPRRAGARARARRGVLQRAGRGVAARRAARLRRSARRVQSIWRAGRRSSAAQGRTPRRDAAGGCRARRVGASRGGPADRRRCGAAGGGEGAAGGESSKRAVAAATAVQAAWRGEAARVQLAVMQAAAAAMQAAARAKPARLRLAASIAAAVTPRRRPSHLYARRTFSVPSPRPSCCSRSAASCVREASRRGASLPGGCRPPGAAAACGRLSSGSTLLPSFCSPISSAFVPSASCALRSPPPRRCRRRRVGTSPSVISRPRWRRRRRWRRAGAAWRGASKGGCRTTPLHDIQAAAREVRPSTSPPPSPRPSLSRRDSHAPRGGGAARCHHGCGGDAGGGAALPRCRPRTRAVLRARRRRARRCARRRARGRARMLAT